MDETNNPTRVRDALPVVVDLLQQRKDQRARALMAAVLGDGPVPCICGRDHGECDT